MRRAHLEAGEDGVVRLAVLSDSHGAPHEATASILQSREPHGILHAGDLGSRGILDDLEGIAPTYAVRGNVDSADFGLPETLTVDVLVAGGAALRILLLHVGIARLRLLREVRLLAMEVEAQLVVCGHSHLPWMGRDGGLVVFNPGSHGPRRYDYPVTMGFVDLDASGVRLSHVDCATGGRWMPG